jgi:proteasome lid subunit RPN8/RPN11
MDMDMEFGELEEDAPDESLRPDQNKHFCVVGYDSPSSEDMPIYVDIDVMRDMELHALSDMNVELGGVLLGGQYIDEDGRPFVVVSDSLRAKHYESTKGSFKFTHDTWSEISRERDEFPDDLQMVGWYHTHPDWGVFLSGMDMFICDNFFARELDVALVIDPCRQDRGMFQWTGNPEDRIRRTDGFFITASRFREVELEQYIAQLEGSTMAHDPRFASQGFSAPVVNVTGNREQPWQGIAIIGILVIQLSFLALIGWKMTMVAEEKKPNDEIAKIEKKLEEMVALRKEREDLDAQRKLLDRIVGKLPGGGAGVVEDLNDANRRLAKAGVDTRSRDDRILVLKSKLEITVRELEKIDASFKSLDKSHVKVRKSYSNLQDKNKDLEEKLKKLTSPEEGKDTGRLAWLRANWIYVAGGTILLMVVGGIAVFAGRKEELPFTQAVVDNQEEATTNNQEEDAEGDPP